MRLRRGYTLVEMLAAITVVGMVLSSLMQGASAINAHRQRAAALVEAASVTQALGSAMNRLIAEMPAGATLHGNDKGLTFKCGGAERCGASIKTGGTGSLLRLRAAGWAETFAVPNEARLEYVTGEQAVATWMPAEYSASLVGVALIGGDPEKPLAFVRVREVEPADCTYDSVTRRCRQVRG